MITPRCPLPSLLQVQLVYSSVILYPSTPLDTPGHEYPVHVAQRCCCLGRTLWHEKRPLACRHSRRQLAGERRRSSSPACRCLAFWPGTREGPCLDGPPFVE